MGQYSLASRAWPAVSRPYSRDTRPAASQLTTFCIRRTASPPGGSPGAEDPAGERHRLPWFMFFAKECPADFQGRKGSPCFYDPHGETRPLVSTANSNPKGNMLYPRRTVGVGRARTTFRGGRGRDYLTPHGHAYFVSLSYCFRSFSPWRQNRVLRLRTYTCNEGKFGSFGRRASGDHTSRDLSSDTGIESVGLLDPQESTADAEDTLIYIMCTPSRKLTHRRIGAAFPVPRIRNGIRLRGGFRKRWQASWPKPPGVACRSWRRPFGGFPMLEITVGIRKPVRICATWWNRSRNTGSTLREGGCQAAASNRQHQSCKITARERIAGLDRPGLAFPRDRRP